MPRPAWAVVGPSALVAALDPLIALRRRQGPVAVAEGVSGDLHGLLPCETGRAAALLVLEEAEGPPQRGDGAGPVLRTGDGRTVVRGRLRGPPAALAAYARTAVALGGRARGNAVQPLILLAPREQRYTRLQDAVAAAARTSAALRVFPWTAERIRPEPLARALRIGLGAVLYAGHGDAGGWLAYRGLRAADLVPAETRPEEAMAILFSLACRTGAPGPAPSFAESMVRRGAVGAVLAPLGDVAHEATCALAPALARSLGEGAAPLATILAAPDLDCVGYVLWGDPAVEPLAADGALHRCGAVPAPAPDATLRPWDA